MSDNVSRIGLTPIDITPSAPRVICLSEARGRYAPAKCRHRKITVDPDLDTVECDECHEKLNPIALLSRYASEESRLFTRIAEMRSLLDKYDLKSRCKCAHCGKMTPIKP